MRYTGMPSGMWLLFERSFRKELINVFGYDASSAAEITKEAHREYRRIIEDLPDFEKGDRFLMNIVSCAMLSGFILHLKERPSVEKMTCYYRNSMMTGPMKWFCRMSGKRKFTPNDIDGLRQTEAFRAADRNPYSWNMEFHPYPDGKGYEARFTKCGICTLMKKLGIGEYIPAMCRLDYTMAEAGGTYVFIRQHTLADGGPYCDCGYLKKER